MAQSTLPRLVLTGPESSGKSALASALSEHLDGVLVGEYLRDYFATAGSLTLEDAIPIAEGQWALEDEAALTAIDQARLLVCDTDLISSLVYTAHYYKAEMNTPLWALWEQWSEQHAKRLGCPPLSPRLYLLCGIDWPWIDDGQRDAPHDRDQFYHLFKQELQNRRCDFLEVSGSLEARVSQVLAHLVQVHLKKG